MKRKLLQILVPLCILFLVAYAAMVHLTNSINRGVSFYSQTVKESKEVAAFEAEYKVESISPFLSDSLKKYGLSHIHLFKLEYWVEQEYLVRYEYLLFKKISYGQGKTLLIKDLTWLGTEHQFYPEIKFAIKNNDEFSKYNSIGNKVLRLGIDNVPQIVILGVFIQNEYAEDIKNLGEIVIKKKIYKEQT